MATIGPVDFTSPSTRFYGDGWVSSQNQPSNFSQLGAQVTCYNGPSGSTASYYGNWGQQWVGFDGIGVVVNHSGTPFLPSGYAQNQLRWQDTGYVNVGHDGNGYHNDVFVRLHIEYSPRNNEYGTWIALPRIPKPPSKTNTPTFISASTTTIEYNFFNAPDNGGSGELTFNHQVARDAAFTVGVQNWDDSSSPGQATGLTPGTGHYIRYRSVNAYGAGPWSDALFQTTLPAVAPGLTITASPSGQSATLAFTPPGGVSGVTKYDWERRLTAVGGGASGSGSFVGASSGTIGSLTPGTSYEWRGSAWIGSYQSPWTSWTALQQPQPNVNPGDFFDGSSLDTADIDYVWTGTPGLSTSRAMAKDLVGWEANLNSGAAVIIRVTGGLFDSYAARVVFTADCTSAGQHFGQSFLPPYSSEVTAGPTYVGSIHVRPSRAQRLAAFMVWLDTTGTVVIGTATGTPMEVPANGTWYRLVVSGIAPAGAVRAIIRVIDVTGTGWSTWKGGDTLDLDGSMISLNELFPYFNGSTPDTVDYEYGWASTAHDSVSSRTTLENTSYDPLADPSCPAPPAPPRPPIVISECIEPPSIWKRYWQSISDTDISDWMAVIPTIEVKSDAIPATQVRVRIYENPLNLAPEAFVPTNWISEQIITYMPAYTLITLDGVSKRAYAQVGSALVAPETVGMIPADKLLYGSDGAPPTWPVLGCGQSYLVSFDAPVDEPPLVRHISLTERMG